MSDDDLESDSPARDYVEAMNETFSAAMEQMQERQAAAIAEVNRLGMAWNRDPFLSPWCRHLGASIGRLAADLMIGFPVVRAAFKALAEGGTAVSFVTSLLVAHPGANDPDLQRELLAEAELSSICLERIMETIDIPANRVPAAHAFIDTMVDSLAWMMDQARERPETH